MAGRTFLRGSTYWIAFSHKGKEWRRSAKTDKKREAESVLSFYLGQCARNEFHGFEDVRITYTIREMLDDLVNDCALRQLRSVKKVQQRANQLIKAWGDIPAADLTERHIDLYVKKRLETAKPATVQREMTYLKQAFKIAKRKKLIAEIPHAPLIRVRNARQGFFEADDFARVVSYLPDYLKDFVRFAYYTGWRKGEIATLEWRDIQDDEIRLRPEVSKNAQGRVVIIAGAVAEIIERRRTARKDLIPYVFYRGNTRLKYIEWAWRTACERAGVAGMLFHDLRRTAVRNMVRAGVPERVAMEISGHKTRSIFDRYNIVSKTDLRNAMQRMHAYLEESGSKVLSFSRISDNRGT